MEQEFRNPLELEKIVEQEKIYEQAKDLHVSATVFYTSNKLAYTDPDCEVKATKEEFIDAYIIGTMLIVTNYGDICKPVSMHIEEDYVAVCYSVASPGADSNTPKYIGVGKLPNLGPS